MSRLSSRLDALEGKQQGGTGVWHRLVWGVGESWDSVLDGYGRDDIKPGDSVMLISVVAPKTDGIGPAPDPVRERDRPAAEAWLAWHEARGKGENLGVIINKG